jgi:hypothetical protein
VVAARPQQPDDLQGLAEQLVPDAHRRPAATHHVLVEPLPGPDAEGEAPVAEQRGGGRGLGDDRRVVAEERAGDAGGQLDPLGAGGDRAQDRPGEAGMLVAVQPWVVVVADLDEVEAGLLGPDRLGHQVLGRERLGEQLVPDLHWLLLAGSILGRYTPAVAATRDRG